MTKLGYNRYSGEIEEMDNPTKGPIAIVKQDITEYAPLFAAAPQLLEACKEALRMMQFHCMLQKENYLTKIIAKAEGRL